MTIKQPVFITNNAFKNTFYCKALGKDIKSLSLEEKTPCISNMTKKSYLCFCGCHLQSKVTLSHAPNWKELLSYLLLMFFIKSLSIFSILWTCLYLSFFLFWKLKKKHDTCRCMHFLRNNILLNNTHYWIVIISFYDFFWKPK